MLSVTVCELATGYRKGLTLVLVKLVNNFLFTFTIFCVSSRIVLENIYMYAIRSSTNIKHEFRITVKHDIKFFIFSPFIWLQNKVAINNHKNK